MIHTRFAVRRDLPQILEIEELCFNEPWDAEKFWQFMRIRNRIGFVACLEKDIDHVMGFAMYELCRSSLHIHNLAVHPSCWRRGVGSTMLRKLCRKVRVVTAEVSECNLEGQLFYARCGLFCLGKFGTYGVTGTDRYVFQHGMEVPR